MSQLENFEIGASLPFLKYRYALNLNRSYVTAIMDEKEEARLNIILDRRYRHYIQAYPEVEYVGPYTKGGERT